MKLRVLKPLILLVALLAMSCGHGLDNGTVSPPEFRLEHVGWDGVYFAVLSAFNGAPEFNIELWDGDKIFAHSTRPETNTKALFMPLADDRNVINNIAPLLNKNVLVRMRVEVGEWSEFEQIKLEPGGLVGDLVPVLNSEWPTQIAVGEEFHGHYAVLNKNGYWRSNSHPLMNNVLFVDGEPVHEMAFRGHYYPGQVMLPTAPPRCGIGCVKYRFGQPGSYELVLRVNNEGFQNPPTHEPLDLSRAQGIPLVPEADALRTNNHIIHRILVGSSSGTF